MSFPGLSRFGPQFWCLLTSLLVHGLIVGGVLALPALAQQEVTEEDVVSVAVVTPDQLQSEIDAARERKRQAADPEPELDVSALEPRPEPVQEPSKATAGPQPPKPAAALESPKTLELTHRTETTGLTTRPARSDRAANWSQIAVRQAGCNPAQACCAERQDRAGRRPATRTALPQRGHGGNHQGAARTQTGPGNLLGGGCHRHGRQRHCCQRCRFQERGTLVQFQIPL